MGCRESQHTLDYHCHCFPVSLRRESQLH
uniref:Uncharacterized protein n=1 Tax=Anguilla anguilla TaxID=7936 RepID=A0A0E9TE25_ANGAN